MQLPVQALIDFDYCPWYHAAGGVEDSDFNKIIRPVVNATLLRYWAYRLQAGGPFTADPVFLAKVVFTELGIPIPEAAENYLRRMIIKGDRMEYDVPLLVGAELATPISKDVTIQLEVPIIMTRRGVTTAVYYSFTPDKLLRKALPFTAAIHGFIPNLLFLYPDIKIDKVVLPYYEGTTLVRRAEMHVDNARRRFEFLATGLAQKIAYRRYGPWCETCPLNLNGKCNILRD